MPCRQKGQTTARLGMAHTACAQSTHISCPQLVCTATAASMHCARGHTPQTAAQLANKTTEERSGCSTRADRMQAPLVVKRTGSMGP